SFLTEDLSAIYALNASTIIGVVDMGNIVRSIDGGGTWTPVTSGTIQNLHDIDFANGSHGVIVGANNTVLETIDGGMNWTSESTANAGNLLVVACRTISTAFICSTQGNI